MEVTHLEHIVDFLLCIMKTAVKVRMERNEAYFIESLSARNGAEFVLYPPGDHLVLGLLVAEENQWNLSKLQVSVEDGQGKDSSESFMTA